MFHLKVPETNLATEHTVEIPMVQDLGDLLTSLTGEGFTQIEPIGGDEVNFTRKAIHDQWGDCVVKLMTRSPLDQEEFHRFLKVEMIFEKLGELGWKVPKIHYNRTYKDKSVYGLMIMEFIDYQSGLSWIQEASTSEKEKFTRSLAHMVKTWHQLSIGDFPDEISELTDYPTNWREIVTSRVQNGIRQLELMGIPSSDQMQIYQKWHKHSLSHVNLGSQIGLVHNDLCIDNLLVDPLHPERIVVLDWEWSGFCDPLQDLVELGSEMFQGDLHLLEIFDKTYNFERGEIFNQILMAYYQVKGMIDTITMGYYYHNPPEDNYQELLANLDHLVQEYYQLF